MTFDNLLLSIVNYACAVKKRCLVVIDKLMMFLKISSRFTRLEYFTILN